MENIDLTEIKSPADISKMSLPELKQLAAELRGKLI